jgi:hypothetical protein
MQKRSILLSSTVAACTLVAVAAAFHSPNVDALLTLDPEGAGARDLLLRALGTGPLQAGTVRIPVPAEGATYEIIVKRPGAPRLTPLS